MSLGTVQSCWRYPVKSLQGIAVDTLSVGSSVIEGDRRYALIDTSTSLVLSAKRTAQLLTGRADDESITLPDGTIVSLADPGASSVLSAWLGREVVLTSTSDLAADQSLSYDMTFDPPDDSSEYYEIPIPAGTFLDLAAVHLVASATLDGCEALRPDLDWDVRRFRPNLVLDVSGEAFVEDDWTGRQLHVGDELVLDVMGPTVRCAMPLRAQPGVGTRAPLERQPQLFTAMGELHAAFPNHLGAYAGVARPGRVAVGDTISLV
jgi:uncharacterized protein YcbX